MGLTEIAEDYLQESRTGRNILHHLVPLLRQSIYSRLAGYDDTKTQCAFPKRRVIVGWQGSERGSQHQRDGPGVLETEFLTQEDNRQALARMNTRWVERAMAHTLHQRVILDMDSSESPVPVSRRAQPITATSCVCYHPLFLFNQFGDCEGAKLRSGVPVPMRQEVLDPVVERYFTGSQFRADAAFAKPEIYEYLETRQIDYAIRLPANEVLQRKIAHLLTRPTTGAFPKAHRLASRFHLPGPVAGMYPEGWWPRWSGTRENCFPAVGFIAPTSVIQL